MEILYMITNTVNGKKYIGHTKQKIYQRMGTHKALYSGCRYLKNAVAKYGWGAFTIEVLERAPTTERARERERELIKQHGTFGKGGYNLTPGGEITPMIFPSVVAKRLATVAKPAYKQKMAAVNAKPEVKERRSQGGKRQYAAESEETRAKRMAAATAPEVVQRRAATLRASKTFAGVQLVAQNRPETATKRKATWEAKREAKLALLPPEEAAKKRAEAARRAVWYAANKEVCNAKIKERRMRQRTSRSRPSCASEEEPTSYLATSDDEGYGSM
jgi:group I intron endonuclease